MIKYMNFMHRAKAVTRCLNYLSNLSHNKELAYLYADQEYGQLNTFFQNALREQNFIELLVETLVISFPTVPHLVEIKASTMKIEKK